MKTTEIQLPGPAGPLACIVESEYRNQVVVSGRRLGKSEQGMRWLVKKAIVCPNPRWKNYYVAPFLKDVREIIWDRLKLFIPSALKASVNNTRLEIKFVNGNTLSLKGADNPGSLVGNSVYSVVFDEFGSMKPLTYQYMRPGLSNTNGYTLFIGTPRGSNHFRDLYFKAKHGKLEEFFAHPIYKTIDSPWVPASEIEIAKSQMDPRMFRQEYEGSFESWIGLVYDDFNDDNIRKLEFDPYLETYIGMDFGWVDPTVLLWMQYDRVNDIWYIIDELVEPFLQPSTIASAIMGEEIQLGRGKFQSKISPDDVNSIITGNEANIRRQEANGYSIKKMLQKSGVTLPVKTKSFSIIESIYSVRAKIRNANNQRKLYVDPSCKKTIRDFGSYHYKEQENEIVGEVPDTSPENHKFSHTMDAIRYTIHRTTPLKQSGWNI